MRMGIAFHIALALGVVSLPGTHAFIAQNKPLRGPFSVNVGSWENDSFLESLSGAKEPPLSAELKAKAAEGNEAGQGGSRFQELLKKSQQAAEANRPQPIMYNPLMDFPPVIPPPPPTPDLSNLSVEEQARMFREMMQRQQQPQQPAPQAYNNPAPAPVSRDPNQPKGRNRDADSIANSSDLYFAQLKRDSTVRTYARYAGDLEKANAVMQDEGVDKLKELLKTNPYLQGETQTGFLETSTEDMIAVMKMTADQEPEHGETYSGVSYRDRLKAKNAKKAAADPVKPLAASPEPVAVQEPVIPAQQAVPVQQVVPIQQAVVPVQQAPVPIQPVTQMAPAIVKEGVVVPEPVAKVSAPVTTDSDEARHSMRTLMGLILKHRGGPGFGAGRLKAHEVEKYKETLAQVTALLRKEVGSNQPTGQAPPPAQTTDVRTVAVPPMVAVPPALSTTLTGVNPLPAETRIASMMACVEGAIQMYKNSPPELQEGILVTLRAALMSAVNTCNQVIAENEVQNYQSYQAAATALPAVNKEVAAPVADSNTDSRRGPSQFFEVAPYQFKTDDNVSLEPVAPSSPAIVAGTDSNSEFLKSVYESLEASAGDKRFGLTDLSPSEAASLADQLVDMRGTLMEELDSGIPETTEPSLPVNEGVAPSKYQQMLAKAKGAKAAF